MHYGSSFSVGEHYSVFKQIIKGKVKGGHTEVISLETGQSVYKKATSQVSFSSPPLKKKDIYTIQNTQAIHNPFTEDIQNRLL